MLTIRLRRRTDHPPGPRRARPGQTLVEFALTLPILLLLIFGIIEFGRMFQAWVTIQNAARTAARYAVTGQYNQTIFQDIDNPWTPDTIGTYMDGLAPDWPLLQGVEYPYGQKPGDGVPCTVNDTRGNFSPTGVNVGGDTWHFPGNLPNNPSDAYFFASRWNGMRCDPNLDEHRWLRNDVLRLVSMTEAARVGAAGLSLAPWMRIPGTGINTEPGGDASLMPGWFHVYVCSSRESMTDQNRIDNNLGRYLYNLEHRTDGTNYGFGAAGIRLCTVEEVVRPDGVTDMNAVGPYTNPSERQGINQYDAGGPGDFVEVVVYFNHPLITPLGLGRNDGSGPYVLLQARRTMINESFRTARVLELPSQGMATMTRAPVTPTDTATAEPSATNTVRPSATSTTTPSITFTSTPGPVCENVSFVAQPPGGGAAQPFMIGQNLQMFIQNDNPGPVYIDSVRMQWVPNATYPDLYPLNYKLFNPDNGLPLPAHWAYNGVPDTGRPNPPQSGTRVDSTWTDWGWRSAEANRIIPGGSRVTTWQGYFVNGPANLSDIYNVRDWPLIEIEVTWPDITSPCVLSYSATPDVTPPPPNPTCVDESLYSLTFVTFQQYGVVRLEFENRDTVPLSITEFSFNWKSYFNGMDLGRVAARGVTAFSPDTVVMWELPGGSPPPPAGSFNTTAAAAGDPQWRSAPVFPAGSSGAIWLDFDGTNGNLQAEYPGVAFISDFNGSYVRLSNTCLVRIVDASTPVPTATYTLTPTNTLTPSRTSTNTPTQTFTPSRTFTVTPSRTLTPTFTPSQTLTPSRTFTPSRTNTPTNTPTRTLTPTITLTPSRTNTPTPTNTLTPASLRIDRNRCLVVDGVLRAEFRVRNDGQTASPSGTYQIRNSAGVVVKSGSVSSVAAGGTRTVFFSPALAGETYTVTFNFPGFPPLTASATCPAATNTPTSTGTPTPTLTRTPTFTPSRTLTPTQTLTPSRTNTPTQTFTPSRTNTPTQTRTPTPTPSRTNTPTQTLTPTRTPTRTPTFTPSNTPTTSILTADLGITKTAPATLPPNTDIEFRVTVTNYSSYTINGANVRDTFLNIGTANGLQALPTWTCSGTGGGTCPGSGSGHINANVNLPPGASVTFVIRGRTPLVAGGRINNTATVTLPSGYVEPSPDPHPNSASTSTNVDDPGQGEG